MSPNKRHFLLYKRKEFIMAINETIVTGRKFRKLIDEANKLWQRISFWTKASDVEFNDGKTAENKVGAISGVTDSLTSTSSNVAASAAAVKALNDKITELSSDLFVGYDQYITWYDGVNNLVLANPTFTIEDHGDWLSVDTNWYQHFIACHKSQKKTVRCTTSGYVRFKLDVSDDGINWTTVLNEIVSSVDAGNHNHNGDFKYTIPEEYNDYTYIKLWHGWNDPYQFWCTISVSIT